MMNEPNKKQRRMERKQEHFVVYFPNLIERIIEFHFGIPLMTNVTVKVIQ